MNADILQIVAAAREAYERVTSLYRKMLAAFFTNDTGRPTARLLSDDERKTLISSRGQLANILRKLDPFVPEMPMPKHLPLWSILDWPVQLEDSIESKIDNLLKPLLHAQGLKERNDLKNELIDKFDARADSIRASFAQLHARFQPALNQLEASIIKVLGAKRLNSQAIADRLKRVSLNSHFKGTLSSMVKSGVLSNQPNPRLGYYNPAKYIPPISHR